MQHSHIRFEEVYRNSVTKLAPARGQSVLTTSVDFSKVDEWYRKWTDSESRFVIKDDAMQFSALKTLFERSWFSRKWTFQEIILARKAIVCCGSLELVWDDLVD